MKNNKNNMKKLMMVMLVFSISYLQLQAQTKVYTLGKTGYVNTIPGTGGFSVGGLKNLSGMVAVPDANGKFVLINWPSGVTTPIATTSIAGKVIPDGITVFVDGSGHISVAPAVGGEPVVAPGSIGQYYRYDKTWAPLTTSVVPEGANLYLTNVRIQTYGNTQWSLLAHNHLLDGLTGVTITSKAANDLLAWNGSTWINMHISTLLTSLGLNNIDNTRDNLKPTSTPQQTSINTAIANISTLLAFISPVANYTLVLADGSRVVLQTVASANTVTVPPNSSVAFPIGIQIPINNSGAGQVTIVPGAGVTLHSARNAFKLAVQYSTGTLIKTGTDTWLLQGDVTP